MKRLLVAVCLVVAGCAKVHINCPVNGIETVTIGGSTVGYTLISMAANAGKAAGFMGKLGATTTDGSGSTVDYSYSPIFGQDFVSCGSMPNPATPGPPAPAP